MITESQLNKDIYRPKEISDLIGMSLRSVQRYMDEGALVSHVVGERNRRVYRSDLVRFLDDKNLIYHDGEKRRDAVYVRVSTHKQKERGDLKRQEEKILAYSATKNPKDISVFSDVSSGLNDKRASLVKLMNEVMENKIDRIFILHKERLTRFGFNYLKLICDHHGTSIIIVSNEERDKTLEEELAEDIISVIHSFSGKLYGMRKTVKSKIDEELS